MLNYYNYTLHLHAKVICDTYFVQAITTFKYMKLMIVARESNLYFIYKIISILSYLNLRSEIETEVAL